MALNELPASVPTLQGWLLSTAHHTRFSVVLEIQPKAASVRRGKHLPYIPSPLVDAEVGSPRRSSQPGPHSGNQAVLLTTGTSAMSQQDISNLFRG